MLSAQHFPTWTVSDSDPTPIGPAMITLRSVIAYLAIMIRWAGIAYIVAQVAIWHSFYTESAWRLVAPALAVAWAAGVTAYLRRNWPPPFLTWADSAVYVVLALGAQACVPPGVRDSTISWLVISMSGQLIVPAWYAPSVMSVLLALTSPLAYLVGAELQPVTNTRMMMGAVILLLVVGLVHRWGRRALCGRATAADADLGRADRAAREEYAVLCRNIERREHERLLNDTVLNTLTTVARGADCARAEVVTRCSQDVALMEAALGGVDDLAGDPVRPCGDLLAEVRAVVTDVRDRGLTVHLRADVAGEPVVPARLITAVANAVREALSNVAAHAETKEAWVSVILTSPRGDAANPCRLQVAVCDLGIGFDPDRIDQTRLGLRRSIWERAAECGGQASIRSAPAQGTKVFLSWPASHLFESLGPVHWFPPGEISLPAGRSQRVGCDVPHS